jgi:hypothetical protein
MTSVYGVGFPPRYGGSDQLFMYIKHSLKRVARVNTTSVFIDIVKVHKQALANYCALLTAKLPTADRDEATGAMSSTSSGSNTSGVPGTPVFGPAYCQ